MDTDTLFEFVARGMKAQAEVNKLCNQPVAHTKDPKSSFKAGEEFHKSGKAESHYIKIMDFLRKNNGSTGHKIADNTSLTQVQVMRRMSELRAKGEVINCMNCQLNLFRCKGGNCAYPIYKNDQVTWWIK